MAKFYGTIGYSVTKEIMVDDGSGSEVGTGKWVDEVIEKLYTGDVIKPAYKWRSTDNINPDVVVSDTISIIADGFMLSNTHSMKYVRWRDACWSIVGVDIERPRVLITLGGLFSGQTYAATPVTP
jgi:hypothetical protein